MQVFEFHFNPKIREGVTYDSFVYEPENFWERKIGRLYVVGSLSHFLPQNLRFLEKLSSLIKKEYYRVTERSPEIALKESLRKVNEFLSEETKQGNVSWLGNLSFGIISLKENIINFASTGEISLFLLRDGRTTDINQALRLQEIEPYPLKIFGNIVSGKVAFGDRIVVLTKEVSDFLNSEKILPEIAKSGEIEEKKLKKILQRKKELYSKVSGICLLINLIGKEKPKGRVTIEKKILPFSIWRTLAQLSKEVSLRIKPISKLKIPQVEIKAPKKIKLPSLSALALPKIELPNLISRIKRGYVFQDL